MAAVFAAASRATFTFIIFAFEITRDYDAIVRLSRPRGCAGGTVSSIGRRARRAGRLAVASVTGLRACCIRRDVKGAVLINARVGRPGRRADRALVLASGAKFVSCAPESASRRADSVINNTACSRHPSRAGRPPSGGQGTRIAEEAIGDYTNGRHTGIAGASNSMNRHRFTPDQGEASRRRVLLVIAAESCRVSGRTLVGQHTNLTHVA
jgi:hypothetical protein